MKSTAIAPSNIALIKYWGKKDEELRLPLNSSISMNLSECLTTTTVEFSPAYKEDTFFLKEKREKNERHKKQLENGFVSNDKETKRVIKHLDRIRKISGINLYARVVSQNSFPKSSGIASSASGFAALTVAACAAAGLKLPERELTILARLGSGSACRSIPDGYAIWEMGSANEDSFAYSLYPPNHWDLRDIILIVEKAAKKVGSTEGMENVWTSPLMKSRLQTIGSRLEKVKKALKEKNFSLLGETTEEECLNMHQVMQTQKPPLFYWTAETIKIMEVVRKWRSQGIPVYFTIDAGPNVHLICEGKGEKEVVDRCKSLKSVKSLIVNKPAMGVRLSHKHLF